MQEERLHSLISLFLVQKGNLARLFLMIKLIGTM